MPITQLYDVVTQPRYFDKWNILLFLDENGNHGDGGHDRILSSGAVTTCLHQQW